MLNMKRFLATLGLLLAFSSPVSAAPQFFSDPVAITLSATGAWTDADVSGSCTQGAATGVALRVRNNEGANNTIGLRKNGSTDNRTQFSGFNNMGAGYIGVDGSEIFEYFVADSTNQQLYLVACFYTDAYFLTNAANVSTGTTGSWVDVDVDSADANCAGAVGAYVEHINTVSVTDGWGIRKNGSTDNRVATSQDPLHGWAAIGVDAGGVFEQNIEGGNADLFLVGCQLTNATFNTDAVNDNLGGTGAYTDLTAVTAGSLGAIYEISNTGASANYGFRRNGSSEDIQQNSRNAGKAWATVAVDASGIAEGTIANTAIDFWQIGYYSPDPAGGCFQMLLGVGSC